MFDDEDLPKRKTDTPAPRKLDDVSVAEMVEYIAWLKSEIARVEQEIDKRGTVKSAAEALFS